MEVQDPRWPQSGAVQSLAPLARDAEPRGWRLLLPNPKALSELQLLIFPQRQGSYQRPKDCIRAWLDKGI